MNKDQIMQAVESASPEQLEKIAAIVEAAPIQVSVTGRHVGCVVKTDIGLNVLLGINALVHDNYELPQGFFSDIANFPNPYRVPITHRWSGGEQPVADDVWVLLEWSDGYFSTGKAAEYNWSASGIIGYTVLDVIGVEDES